MKTNDTCKGKIVWNGSFQLENVKWYDVRIVKVSQPDDFIVYYWAGEQLFPVDDDDICEKIYQQSGIK